MYELSDTWASTPALVTIAEMPQVPLEADVAGGSESSQQQKFANMRWLEAQRQAVHELEDIQRVSARLFPRNLPQLASLAYAGVCVEARGAGGDFYDFFDRGPHRLGFVVADVSGKGMASALVRSSLQASLRTLSSMGVQELDHSLALVNRLLFESTPEAMYATLFLAEYDANTRRLRYVNCGHPAPLLVGDDGVRRLHTTAQVLGLFSDWKGAIGEVQLGVGDTLLVYTDGVTEASNHTGEEFGEERLLALLQRRNEPLSDLLRQCVDEACRFETGSQHDDLTVVALRSLEV